MNRSRQAHPSAEKLETVKKLAHLFQQAKGIYLADFTGLNVEEANELRRNFHKQQVIYKVVKNTLIRHACEELGYQDLIPHLEGPTALAISIRDPILPVRLISSFTKDKEKQTPVIKAGLLEGAYISAADVVKVRDIPPREVLVGQILSILQAPLANLVGTLNEIVRSFLAVLEAIIQKQQAAAEDAAQAEVPGADVTPPSE